ncbi:hypothetical protein IQ17_07259 [Bradyrhizobium daqingense]|uniref:Uncharacterized protein n=1 Tax=Bradyrhizobium daqingense TaxID=993502 RepID=A0A562KA17_9BRAD|nr:hypothetical protein IQ17_07259 [Bradyrhizobium daqingense]
MGISADGFMRVVGTAAAAQDWRSLRQAEYRDGELLLVPMHSNSGAPAVYTGGTFRRRPGRTPTV